MDALTRRLNGGRHIHPRLEGESMPETPHNTLPSADQIRLAISSYFRGGGTTNLIVNVCRREAATTTEAQQVASRLAKRFADGKTFVSDEVVVEHLEIVRAVAATAQDTEDREAKSPTPPIGSAAWHAHALRVYQRSMDRFGSDEGYRAELAAWAKANKGKR
jgi:hypothetical protein